MQIAHLGTSDVGVLSERGGALQRRIWALSKGQADRGHDVLVFSPAQADYTEERDGVRLVHVGLRCQRPQRDLEFLLKIRRHLAGQEVDILHAHGAPHAAVVLRSKSSACVLSVDYFEYRGSASRFGRTVYSTELRKFDALLAVSSFTADSMAAYYPSVASRITVVPNGVDSARFEPNAEAAKSARDALAITAPEVVLYVGRICEQKGSDRLAALARRLASTHPTAQVVAAGPAEVFGAHETSPLMAELMEAGVLCLGAVDEQLLPGLMSSADVFVLPTRRDEMFGMAGVEAAACGTPVVASDLGGIPEAVGPDAILVSTNGIDDLEAAILLLLESPKERDRRSAATRRYVERYRWDSVIDLLEKEYARALELR